jgi:hypothetical protein
MKAKRIFALAIAVLVCLIALVSVASAQAFSPTPPTQDEGATWTVEGGGYRLVALAWPRSVALAETSALASGGRYRLWSPALQGSGCCCTYLPCVMRNTK